jgi:hypothetical protein
MIKESGIKVRRSKEFKLKDRVNRNLQVIHIKDFGFIPETLIFERVKGNWFAISAVLTEEEIKKMNEKKNDN